MMKGFIKSIKNNRLFNRFKKMGFRKKLIFSFIFVSIIPILLVQSISYFYITSAMKENVDDLVKVNLTQAKKNLDITMNSYIDIMYQIYIDDEIIKSINKINQESDSAMEISLLREKLGNLVNSKLGIRSITILCANGKDVFYDILTASAIESSWMNKNFNRKAFYDNIANSSGFVLIPPSYPYQLGDDQYYLLHIAKTMVDFNNISNGKVGDPIGVIVISVDESYIYKACNDEGDGSENNSSVKSVNFITDTAGSIVSFSDKTYIGTKISAFNEIDKDGKRSGYKNLLETVPSFKENTLITNDIYDDETGWIIVNAVDQKVLFNKVYSTQRFTVIFGVLALLISIAVIIYASKNFSEAIGKILTAMKTAQEGELSVRVDLEEGNDDEISAIAVRFNKMIYRINKLMEEVKCATFKQKEAEIRALEAQINPHFLYNTLDAINWMAIEKDEHEISNMLKSLAQILRYSVNRSNNIVKLREEIEWLKQYIYLQQARFNYSFSCLMDIEEGTLDCKVHKLLFQPFIENAIIHGFEGLKDGGVLTIRTRNMGDSVHITIEDNGKGIDKAIVDALNSKSDAEIESKGSGLGVQNVFNRIMMYYGEKGNWMVTSTIGKGTSICLQIPIL